MVSDEKPETDDAESTTPPPVPAPDSSAAESKETVTSDADKGEETEIGGREGPDPTRYGDWEINGRCVDF